MKKITLSVLIILMTGFLINLTAQEQELPEKEKRETKMEKKEQETSPKTPGPPSREAHQESEKNGEKEPEKSQEADSSENIKKVSPNKQEGAGKRSSARPGRGARPEIIRPERGRPAGAGRPKGAGRPGRN